MATWVRDGPKVGWLRLGNDACEISDTVQIFSHVVVNDDDDDDDDDAASDGRK